MFGCCRVFWWDVLTRRRVARGPCRRLGAAFAEAANCPVTSSSSSHSLSTKLVATNSEGVSRRFTRHDHLVTSSLIEYFSNRSKAIMEQSLRSLAMRQNLCALCFRALGRTFNLPASRAVGLQNSNRLQRRHKGYIAPAGGQARPITGFYAGSPPLQPSLANQTHQE